MSELIQKNKYKRMLKSRTNLIQKKIGEIEGIKIKYGTVPSMTGVQEMRHQLALWKSDLEG